MVDREIIKFIMKKLGVITFEKFNLPESDRNPYYFDDLGNLIDCEGNANEDFDYLLIDGDDKITNLIMKKIGVKPFERFIIDHMYDDPHYFDDSGYLIDSKGDRFCDRAYFIYNSPVINKLPPKKMTISEIEKELRCKIAIVSEKEEKE